MRKARSFTENMEWESFSKDDKTLFAVIRAIEIIGEAVRNIFDDIKARHPDVL